MIYHLLMPLGEAGGIFNVIRYQTFRGIMATMTAFIVCFLIAPYFIKEMRARQYGQEIRGDGPKSHLAKQGTPTMGGTFILLGLAAGTLLWSRLDNPYVWLVLVITFGYGALGLLDDYRKIRQKSSRGVPARWKFAWQIIVAAVSVSVVFFWNRNDPALSLSTVLVFPFFKDASLDLGYAYIPFAVVVIVAWGNAVNLTDGLDGLAIGPTILAAVTFGVFAYAAGHGRVAEYLQIPFIPFAGELAVFCAATFGAGLAFLWFNTYPAQVFMGDVGSLALGGALGAIAVVTKNEIVSIIIGGVFVLETASVILQVASFKLTGKRLFKMAPIHHHFELKGWAEPKVIVRFWIISILLALAAFATLKLR